MTAIPSEIPPLKLHTKLLYSLGSVANAVKSRGLATFLMLSVLWRAAWRAAFVAREYGWSEAGFAVLRIPVANVIGIMAGWRALAAYCGNLRGAALRWDKTTHAAHPAAGVRLGSPT